MPMVEEKSKWAKTDESMSKWVVRVVRKSTDYIETEVLARDKAEAEGQVSGADFDYFSDSWVLDEEPEFHVDKKYTRPVNDYKKSINEANYTDEEKIMFMHSYIAKARAYYETIDDEYKALRVEDIGETLEDLSIDLWNRRARDDDEVS